jgi:esterase/lipase
LATYAEFDVQLVVNSDTGINDHQEQNRMLDISQAFSSPQYQPFALQASSGHALLLVHGFGGTPHEMLALGQGLHQNAYTAQGILLDGFGRNITQLEQYSGAHWLQQISRCYQELCQTHAHVTLVGFSMGGALCIQVASIVKPYALILVNPFWKFDSILWQALPVLKFVVPTFKPFQVTKVNFADERTRQNLLGYFPNANLDDAHTQQEIINFGLPTKVFDTLRSIGQAGFRAIPKVTVPTLIVQGAQDEVAIPRLTLELSKRFRNAQYHSITGSHNLLENPPDMQVALSIILNFLNQKG